jgi:phosphatidylinositol-3-phosphatase
MADERRCGTCGSPMDGDQRYCLTCGERDGARSPQLQALMRRAGAGERTPRAAVESEAVESSSSRLELPGPRISAVLVAAFVGFGALIGNAVATSTVATPAREVIAEAPATTPPATTTGSTPPATEGGEKTSTEAPESEPETTPEPATPATTAGTSTTPAAPKEEASGSQEKTASKKSASNTSAAPKLTDVKHVFVVMLSDEPYASLFGPESTGKYLAGTLEHKGELLVSYDAIAHEQLPNGIALLSGQGPTAQTATNCPLYTPVSPATVGADGAVIGNGCVYPASVETLPGELAGKHLHWRAYVQGIDEGAGQPGPCPHPASGAAEAGSGSYASYRNPFVYFEALALSPACQTSDVGLSALKGDLASVAKTPSFSYIVPDRCHDANPVACSPGAVAGPASATSTLEEVVPEILASPAYKKDGLLVITGDEAPSSGALADSSSCCGQPKYPNYTAPGFGQGGGQVGALLLSPLIKGGTTSSEQYDHFSLLRTIEDIFGVHHLGYSGLPAVKSFAASLLNAKS